MKDKLFITGLIIIFGAYFVILIIDIKDYQERKKKAQEEVVELRIRNARLEEQLKALDDKQAERTRITAERNGVGG